MGEQQVPQWSTIILVITMLRSIVLGAEPLLWNADAWMGDHAYCGVSQKQGRRPYQEDRVICMPELLLQGPGGCSTQVGLFGVFDGHNGAEASEFASTYLPHLLRHHTWSILMHESHQAQSGVCVESDLVGQNIRNLPLPCFDEKLQRHPSVADENGIRGSCREDKQFSDPSYRAILKEAISRSLTDLEFAIVRRFEEQEHQSGSTAVVVLKLNSHLLVANIGDSQAFVCSSTTLAADGKTARAVSIKELTIAHHPDRVDERFRIEAAGGFVSTWGGIARVNGQLAVSRALGDATFKKFGVIAEPEFFGWQEFTADNAFLIVASDGIFERMHPQQACNLLQVKHMDMINSSLLYNDFTVARLHYGALAESIVAAAYDSGSYDNLAVVVYPLISSSSLIRTYISTETLKSSQTCNELLSYKQLKSSEDASYCYEVIHKAPNGVVLPLESSVGLISSAGADKVLRSNALIKDSIDIDRKYRQSTGSAALLEVYHEHLVCFRRPVLSEEDEVCLNPETFSTYLQLIEGVPLLEKSSSGRNTSGKVKDMQAGNFYSYTSVHRRYLLTENIGRGGFGEVWFAAMKNCSNAETTDKASRVEMVDDIPDESDLKGTLIHKLMESNAKSMRTDHPQELFVLKRILAEKGNAVFLSGLREKHFGKIFLNALTLRNSRSTTSCKTKPVEEAEDGLNHVARYVESIQGSNEEDFWLVFINEGYSLSSLLYTTDTTIEKDKGHVRVLEPSNWWKWLKSTKDGHREMRDLLYQLLLGVKACHDRNITHRDIKPENMMVRPRGLCLAHGKFGQLELPCNLSMRIIDFGSAIDAYSLQNLYGPTGPTRHEQTEEYTPPESFLGRNMWRSYGMEATRYDLWSIGVVMLELVLGTPHVFQVAARTRVLLDKHLEGWGTSALNTAYMLRAMMELCILYPGKSGHHRPAAMDNSNLASWVCTEENLMLQIKNRDPLGLGLEDVWALRLLRKLLQWHPEDRITVDEALAHPYFHSPLQGTENDEV